MMKILKLNMAAQSLSNYNLDRKWMEEFGGLIGLSVRLGKFAIFLKGT